MKYTFATPNRQCAERCEKPHFTTVEANTEAEAREKAMLERWGSPRGKLAALGVHRWTGQGLIREESK